MAIRMSGPRPRQPQGIDPFRQPNWNQMYGPSLNDAQVRANTSTNQAQNRRPVLNGLRQFLGQFNPNQRAFGNMTGGATGGTVRQPGMDTAKSLANAPPEVAPVNRVSSAGTFGEMTPQQRSQNLPPLVNGVRRWNPNDQPTMMQGGGTNGIPRRGMKQVQQQPGFDQMGGLMQFLNQFGGYGGMGGGFGGYGSGYMNSGGYGMGGLMNQYQQPYNFNNYGGGYGF